MCESQRLAMRLDTKVFSHLWPQNLKPENVSPGAQYGEQVSEQQLLCSVK